jgi:hypothetical protein
MEARRTQVGSVVLVWDLRQSASRFVIEIGRSAEDGFPPVLRGEMLTQKNAEVGKQSLSWKPL